MSFLNIKNPQKDGRVIYINPRQGFSIHLDAPENATKHESWQVEIYSEFFLSYPTIVKDNSRIYSFQQIYDLNEWAKYSSVQIAEVRIYWKGRKLSDNLHAKTLYVVLKGKNEVLTLLNPISGNARIYTHQMLEVVIFSTDNLMNDYDCLNSCEVKMGNPDIEVEEIGKKTIIKSFSMNRSESGILSEPYVLNRYPGSLPLNPLSNCAFLAKRLPVTLYRATHFFFQISRNSIADAKIQKNLEFKACDLTFYSDKNVSQADFSVEVNVEVKEKFKNLVNEMMLLKRKSYFFNNDVNNVDQKTIAKERVFNKNKLLVAPLDMDNVEFINGEDNALIIQIADPHVYDDYASVEAKWELEIESVWQIDFSREPEKRIAAMEIDNRKIGKTNIQRFMVTPIKKLKSEQKIMFLGILKLICNEIEELFKIISVYLLEGSDYKDTYTGKFDYGYTNNYKKSVWRARIYVIEYKDDSLIPAYGGKLVLFSQVKKEKDV